MQGPVREPVIRTMKEQTSNDEKAIRALFATPSSRGMPRCGCARLVAAVTCTQVLIAARQHVHRTKRS